MGAPVKGRADFLDLGDWNASCAQCGRKRKAKELVRNWQGTWRCPDHNEPRQPQDFVRAVPDVQSVPWSQPQTDIDVLFCSINTRSAIPSGAGPGCSIPGNTIYDPNGV